MDYIFVKTPITSFLDFLGPTDSTGLFFRNWASSLTLLYGYLTSCKKIREKLRINFDILLCKWTDGRTNERMERRTDPNSEYTFASADVQKHTCRPRYVSKIDGITPSKPSGSCAMH